MDNVVEQAPDNTANPIPSGSCINPPSPAIDSHVHCFAGRDDPRFPYHPNGPYQPSEAATPEHLLKCMNEAGVDYAVVAHPEPYQDDHRYLEHCLEVVEGHRLDPQGRCGVAR